MTIIVGVSDKSGVWLASDRRITAGTSIEGSTRKIFRASADLGYGFCGSLRTLNIIKHLFRPPATEFKVKDKEACEFYLISEFIPSLVEVLSGQKCLSEDDPEVLSDNLTWNGNLLIAIGPNLFSLVNDFAIIEMGKYGAIGSGSPYARAVLCDMDGDDITGDDKCRRAVKVASSFDTGCDNHIEIVKMR